MSKSPFTDSGIKPVVTRELYDISLKTLKVDYLFIIPYGGLVFLRGAKEERRLQKLVSASAKRAF